MKSAGGLWHWFLQAQNLLNLFTEQGTVDCSCSCCVAAAVAPSFLPYSRPLYVSQLCGSG